MSFIANAYTSHGLLAAALTIGVLSTSYLYTLHTKSTKSSPDTHELKGIWIMDAWPFFSRRFEFLSETFRRTGKKLLRFRVLKHSVLAASGIDARTVFLNEKGLSLGEGYKILSGMGPDLAEIKVETGGLDEDGNFVRQLLSLTTKERIQDVFPSFANDIHRAMVPWGQAGSINPFTEVYNTPQIVLQMTVRMATCTELADDPASVAILANLYLLLEKGATPVGVLLPWFPSPARKGREKAMMYLFGMLYKQVETRRNAAVPSSDAFDVLLSQGSSTEVIVGLPQFVLRTIFAGVINSAVNASWAIVYLGMTPEWKEKSTAEIQALLAKHSASNEPLHTRLGSIPIAAWEEELPALDAVLRETLRLVMGGVALRRNLAPSGLAVGKETLARGEFLAYPLADVHLDPSIYPDPLKFDPARYDVGREEDKRAQFGYLGWGAGRHPCAGMKLAKLEMKLVLAFFLAGFNYQVVDGAGNPLTAVPKIDRNDNHMPRPLKTCNIKFKRTMQ
ncbi:cytochrome P450 [Mycena crocata]|nr:cytochrome P450 [Mycena crocata]